MPKSRRSPTRVSQPISLDGFYRHKGVTECVAFIERALERAGVKDEPPIPYQRDVLRDLSDPLDEEALAEMLAYWTYDLPKLLKRGRGYHAEVPAKPQIDIVLEITSKGNFKAEWFPRDVDHWGQSGDVEGCDFVVWRRAESRGMGYHTRPSNELFFIHGVEHCVYSLKDRDPGPRAALDHVLLTACAKVVDMLKARLSYHFDVKMITDLFVEWAEDEEGRFSNPDGFMSPSIVTSWQIEDPEVRRKRIEISELDEMAERLGFSEAEFIEARDYETHRVRPTGPAPAPHTFVDRLVREMKKRGLKATRSSVERAIYLVERYRNVVPIR